MSTDDQGEVTTMAEYEDGTRVIGITSDPEDPAWVMGPDRYRAIAADGRSYEPRDRMYLNRRRRALILGELYHRFGYLDPNPAEDMIPVSIVVEGKPAVAAYLRAVHGLRAYEFAEKLDVSIKTAYQYTDHFKNGRR